MAPHVPHEVLADGTELKRCGSCEVYRPLFAFCRRTASRDGLAARCRDCDKVKSRKWFEENRQRHYANTRRWVQENPAGRVAIRKRWDDANADYYRQWREVNADRKKSNDAAWYAANREQAQAASRAWKDTNPEAYREHARRYTSRRRARIRDLPHEAWTEQQVIDRDGLTCWMCSTEIGGVLPSGVRDWHVDHLIPLAVAETFPDHPGDTLPNLAIACAACNYSKNAQLLPAAIERYEVNLLLIA